MFDSHDHPLPGLLPVIRIGSLELSSYTLFFVLALGCGFILFRFNIRRGSSPQRGQTLSIILAALLGSLIGSKVPVLFESLTFHPELWKSPALWLTGQSITGGLAGGTIGIMIYKKAAGIRGRYGNAIAGPAALAMAIGRIGCFLNGCCCGIASGDLPGIDMGDGIPRVPVQLIDGVFCLILAVVMQLTFHKRRPGAAFRDFLLIFFSFRFLIEFIRINPKLPPRPHFLPDSLGNSDPSDNNKRNCSI